MRLASLLLLLISASACAPTVVSGPAICAGLKGPRVAHADALIEHGAPEPVIATGIVLLDGLKAGCAD